MGSKGNRVPLKYQSTFFIEKINCFFSEDENEKLKTGDSITLYFCCSSILISIGTSSGLNK